MIRPRIKNTSLPLSRYADQIDRLFGAELPRLDALAETTQVRSLALPVINAAILDIERACGSLNASVSELRGRARALEQRRQKFEGASRIKRPRRRDQ